MYVRNEDEMPRARYQELRAFCLQYPIWKREVQFVPLLPTLSYDGIPHGTDLSDPTAKAVERRERHMQKIDMVDACARNAGGEQWYAALILNVCRGVGYEAIRDLHSVLPTNNRSAFFAVRRRFFSLLNQVRG